VACRALCVLLFLAWTAERNGDRLLYCGMWRSPLSVFAPLFDSIPGVHQPAWNLMLVVLAPFCLLQPGAFRKRAWPLDAAIALGLATIGFGFLWGLTRGGDAYFAYYQVHALVVSLFVALLLRAAVRSADDLRFVGLTLVAAAVVRALLALYFFFSFVRGRERYPPHMTSHDDSPLFVAGVVLALVWAFARRRFGTWALSGLAIVVMLLAMKVNNRRIVWFELAVALGFLYLLPMARGLRRRANRWLMVALPVLALYAAVGWRRPGPLFAPLRAVDSATGDNQDDSSLARNEENLNLMITYIQHPILGSGWGHPFVSVSSYYAHFGGGWDTMYRYTPHNSLAGLIAFTGLVGLFGTLSAVPVAAFLAGRAAREARAPTEHAAALGAVCLLPVFGLHAYGDIGLQSLSACLVLSVALAAAGRVSTWTGAWPERQRRARRRSALPPDAPGVADAA
jgi:hypothetical protein